MLIFKQILAAALYSQEAKQNSGKQPNIQQNLQDVNP
jgi:hypothetical protein